MRDFGVVLVTGASTGIGQAVALDLDARGYSVLAGVRRAADADALRAAASDRLTPLRLDVTRADDIAAAAEAVAARGGLFALINNAGFNYVAPFEASDFTKARAVLDTNIIGLAALTQALLPQLRRATSPRRWARVLNVSSIGGLVGVPWEPWYHASKFAVVGLSESLRTELHAQHIAVSVVCPGGIRTPFVAKSGAEAAAARATLSSEMAALYGPSLDRLAALVGAVERAGSPPRAVAQTVADLLRARRPRFLALVGGDAALMLAMKRLAPRGVFDGLMRAAFTARS